MEEINDMNGNSAQDRNGKSTQDRNGNSTQSVTQSVSLGELTSELMGTEISLNSETAVDVCRDAGWRFTGAALLVAALWMKAYKGDVNAAKIVRELNGEGTKEDEAVSLDSLSDAELYRMAMEAEPKREEHSGAAERAGAESDAELYRMVKDAEERNEPYASGRDAAAEAEAENAEAKQATAAERATAECGVDLYL